MNGNNWEMLFNRASSNFERGHMCRAKMLGERALEMSFQLNDSARICYSIAMLGRCEIALGNLESAIHILEKAPIYANKADEDLLKANALAALGVVYRDVGRLSKAIPLLEEALSICKKSDNRMAQCVCYCSVDLARALLYRNDNFKGDLLVAEQLLIKAIPYSELPQNNFIVEIGNRILIWQLLLLLYLHKQDFNNAFICAEYCYNLRMALRTKGYIPPSPNLSKSDHEEVSQPQIKKFIIFINLELDNALKSQDVHSHWSSLFYLGLAYQLIDLNIEHGLIYKLWRIMRKITLIYEHSWYSYKARKYFTNAIDELETKIRSKLANKNRISFLEYRIEVYERLIHLHIMNKNPLKAFEYIERCKSRTLYEILSGTLPLEKKFHFKDLFNKIKLLLKKSDLNIK